MLKYKNKNTFQENNNNKYIDSILHLYLKYDKSRANLLKDLHQASDLNG